MLSVGAVLATFEAYDYWIEKNTGFNSITVIPLKFPESVGNFGTHRKSSQNSSEIPKAKQTENSQHSGEFQNVPAAAAASAAVTFFSLPNPNP